MTDRPAVLPLTPPTDILGETPVWHPGEGALYWVDVRGGLVRRLVPETGRLDAVKLDETVGSLAPRRGGGLVVALRTRIVALDMGSGSIRTLAALDGAAATMRFNDGACDRQGRFWVGSMDDVSRAPVGSLYRLDGEGFTAVLDEVSVPNSLCWSLDSRTMYFSDGAEPVIWAYEFDAGKGRPGRRRVFARLPDGSGIPDGATIDAEDHLWCAIYGAGRIDRYAPDGGLVRSIDVPVSQPTCCAFGGPDLMTLFVTTARQRLSEEALASQPLAGSVLALSVGVRGVAEPEFGP